jgi:hypothetical protein
MLTIQEMKNQNIDKTPYTDEQLLFLNRILGVVTWPWVPFSEQNTSVKIHKGAFGDAFVLHIDDICNMTTFAVDILDHRMIFEGAFGDVLLTGLGLGLGALLAYHNSNVNSITVIENNPVIIEKITPMICNNMTRIVPKIIAEDANIWIPNKHFDFAYIDHHAGSRSDSERYLPYCSTVVNWYDERVKLEASWR